MIQKPSLGDARDKKNLEDLRLHSEMQGLSSILNQRYSI